MLECTTYRESKSIDFEIFKKNKKQNKKNLSKRQCKYYEMNNDLKILMLTTFINFN